MLIKGENLLRKCANFIHSTHLEVGSSILPRRKFCPKSLMGDAHEIFVYGNEGLGLKVVHYNLNCIVGTL